MPTPQTADVNLSRGSDAVPSAQAGNEPCHPNLALTATLASWPTPDALSARRPGEAEGGRACSDATGRNPWSDLVWLPCTDGKARPAQPEFFPLAHGIPGRVGRLRAYGNVIVPQVASRVRRCLHGSVAKMFHVKPCEASPSTRPRRPGYRGCPSLAPADNPIVPRPVPTLSFREEARQAILTPIGYPMARRRGKRTPARLDAAGWPLGALDHAAAGSGGPRSPRGMLWRRPSRCRPERPRARTPDDRGLTPPQNAWLPPPGSAKTRAQARCGLDRFRWRCQPR